MTLFEEEVHSLLQNVLTLSESCAVGEITDAQFNDEMQSVKLAIKQAVSTHIIGEDEPEITGHGKDGRPNIAHNYVFVNRLNTLRSKQRKALGEKA